jgi:hypothetical protein
MNMLFHQINEANIDDARGELDPETIQASSVAFSDFAIG